MKFYLGWLAALLTAVSLTADDRAALLETEREYVAELLALERPKMAQMHLDIIREVFPDKVETIHYYQGKISFIEENYRTANHNFANVLEQNPSPMRRTEARRRLVEGHTKLKQFDQALDHLSETPPRGGKGSWYANALIDLAEATHQDLGKKPASDRVKAKGRVQKYLKQFQTKFPEDPNLPRIKYYLAEYAYDQLIALLYDKGKIKDEISPVVLERKDDVIAAQLHQTRQLFKNIKKKWPDHKIIKRVDPRLRYLDQLIEKMVSGQPE